MLHSTEIRQKGMFKKESQWMCSVSVKVVESEKSKGSEDNV